MKYQPFLFALSLLSSVSAFAQGGAFYVEFYGNGLLHRGVIVMNAYGRGQCRVSYQSQQGNFVVDQQVQQTSLQAQSPGYYNPSQPAPNQGFILACSAPVFANTGQYAQGYAADNFFVFSNGQMLDCDASGGRCPVSYRMIQSEQELQSILQTMGGSATPSNTTRNPTYPPPTTTAYPTSRPTPSVPAPTTPVPTKKKGPNIKPGSGGLGN